MHEFDQSPFLWFISPKPESESQRKQQRRLSLFPVLVVRRATPKDLGESSRCGGFRYFSVFSTASYAPSRSEKFTSPSLGNHELNLQLEPPRTLPPPFRNRAASTSNPDNRLPRITGSPGRLWNPTNSTPRLPPPVYTRTRRPSTPPPPPFPHHNLTLDVTTVVSGDHVATDAGDYPLLTLPEQRQSRHLTPTRTSFQIEGQLGRGNRISLPSSVRHPYHNKGTPAKLSGVDTEFGLSNLDPKQEPPATQLRKATPNIEKGKAKAAMSHPGSVDPARGFSNDLERGPVGHGRQQNMSNISLPRGMGSATSSNSSMVGDPDQPGLGEEWGPQHPCFPHMNPYVPINSTEYRTTRIIRVRRDWLIAGDLAPTFSNIYPEILDPAGVSEQEFRRVIEKLNGSLIPTFNPYNWRNILDGVLGVLTGWVWEDLGLTNVKTKLKSLEAWIDQWNADMEKTIGSETGTIVPKIISLRRTGYMTVRYLSFQITHRDSELTY